MYAGAEVLKSRGKVVKEVAKFTQHLPSVQQMPLPEVSRAQYSPALECIGAYQAHNIRMLAGSSTNPHQGSKLARQMVEAGVLSLAFRVRWSAAGSTNLIIRSAEGDIAAV